MLRFSSWLMQSVQQQHGLQLHHLWVGVRCALLPARALCLHALPVLSFSSRWTLCCHTYGLTTSCCVAALYSCICRPSFTSRSLFFTPASSKSSSTAPCWHTTLPRLAAAPGQQQHASRAMRTSCQHGCSSSSGHLSCANRLCAGPATQAAAAPAPLLSRRSALLTQHSRRCRTL